MTADMPPSHVKIFGERNTSTNALKGIIAQNAQSPVLPSTVRGIDRHIGLKLKWLARGSDWRREALIDRAFAKRGPREAWKHCATIFNDVSPFSDTVVLFCVRHPASWLMSLYKNPYQMIGTPPDTLAAFAEAGWKTVQRERLSGVTLTPLELYQAKLDSYFAFSDKLEASGIPHIFLKFEDIVLHQREVFTRIAPHLIAPAEDFQELQKSTKSSSKSLEYYKDYYGNERWRAEVEAVRDPVNTRINWPPLTERFGYRPL